MVLVMVEVDIGDGGEKGCGGSGDDRDRCWCIKCKRLHGRTIPDGVSAKFRAGTAAAVSMRMKMRRRKSLPVFSSV